MRIALARSNAVAILATGIVIGAVLVAVTTSATGILVKTTTITTTSTAQGVASSTAQQPVTSDYTSELLFTSSSCSLTSTDVTNVLPITSESQLISMVNASFSEHIQHLTSRDTFASTNDFQDGAQVVWSGYANAGGYAGNYTGLRAINEVLEAFLEETTSLSMANSTWTVSPTGDDSALVNSTLVFSGHSNVLGNFDAQAHGVDYVQASGQISREVWNFTKFDDQLTFTDAPYSPADDSCYP